jgi:hypothetical protein
MRADARCLAVSVLHTPLGGPGPENLADNFGPLLVNSLIKQHVVHNRVGNLAQRREAKRAVITRRSGPSH